MKSFQLDETRFQLNENVTGWRSNEELRKCDRVEIKQGAAKATKEEEKE